MVVATATTVIDTARIVFEILFSKLSSLTENEFVQLMETFSPMGEIFLSSRGLFPEVETKSKEEEVKELDIL